MGGGSKNTVQKSEVVQSTLPEYARPYYEGLMQRAEANLTTPYQPYGQERIAGFTQQQRGVQNDIMGQKTPGQFGQATDLVSQAGLGSLSAGKYDPTAFNSQMFGSEQAQQYMSPYVQNVLDIQKREAATDAQKSQLMQNLGAGRQGTYGGSRQLLAGLARERDLGQQMGDIQAKGLQSAYESAQQQFERDRRQQFEAQQASEQSRQFGSQQGLAGLAQAGQMGQTLSNIGSAQSQADQARFGLQTSTAAQQQALNQQYMDTAYQDFLRQRDYPMEQLQQYSSLLRGVPVTPNSTSTTYAPNASLGSQLMGGGLAAAGIYNTFKGG
jgi:hypothetical protein